MRRSYLYILLLILITTSCEKVIEYEIPREPEKIVMDCRLIENTQVIAFLNTSVYSLSTDEPTVDRNFKAYLLEDNIPMDTLTPYDSLGSIYYMGDFIPTSGHHYKLEVERKGFETAYGSDYLHQAVNITYTEYDTTGNQNDVIIEFKDPTSPEDYYMFSFALQQPDNSVFPISFTTIDPTVEVFGYSGSFDDDGTSVGYLGFVSDEYFNGEVKRLELQFEDRNSEPTPGLPISQPIRLELVHISRDFYLHERSKALHNQSIQNPLAEPVQVYSNIINGYGIVAAGASTSVLIFP